MYPIGNSFIILESVDSTNNYAMGKVHAGLAKQGDTYFSLTQTAGRGQRGKSWESGIGLNIILSCIIQPHVYFINDPIILSMATALGCYDFVNHYTGHDTSIKWPNDICWRDKKAGGILIENRFKGVDWQYAVIGIGVNINQTSFSAELSNAVSLKQVTGNTYDVVTLAKHLCGFIQGRLELASLNNILESYNRHLYKYDESVTLKVNNVVFETRIKGVNHKGQLMTFSDHDALFNWGEVEWVR